jgi:hypothetical protein
MAPSGDLGNVHLDRKEAMAMLKALADSNLVEPSYVHICLRKPNHYQIQIKCDYNKTEIEAYAKKYGLTITEDKERKYLVIYKP